MFGQTTNCTRGTSRPYGARSACRGSGAINIASLRDWLKGCAIGQILVWLFGGRTILLLLILCLLSLPAPAQSGTTKPEPSPSPDNATLHSLAKPVVNPTPPSDQKKKADRDPIDKADEYKSKLTFSTYFTRGNRAFDLNLRHQLGPVTVWIAGFYDPQTNKLIRTGIQYDYRKAWFHFVPTIEVATTKAVSGSLSFELGSGRTIALVGYSRTNLKPFFDLFWDPGDSVQLGIGHRLTSYDRIQV